MQITDEFKTIAQPSSEAIFKDRGSKFLGYAYPIKSEKEVAPIILKLKESNHKARHWCYAWRLGVEKVSYRVNDDGEPNNSAGNPIYLIRDNKLDRLDADRIPINFHDVDMLYSKKEIDYLKGDCIYIFTDGYIDQFGGAAGKKLMARKFKDTLLEIHDKDMQKQKNMLASKFESWKGKSFEQVDDALVIGIKI